MRAKNHKAIREHFTQLGWGVARQKNIIMVLAKGRVGRLEEMSAAEAEALIAFLEARLETARQRRDKLRKTLLAQGYSVGWTLEHTIGWCEKHGAGKKRFNAYVESELMKMIKILESIQIKRGVGADMKLYQLSLN